MSEKTNIAKSSWLLLTNWILLFYFLNILFSNGFYNILIFGFLNSISHCHKDNGKYKYNRNKNWYYRKFIICCIDICCNCIDLQYFYHPQLNIFTICFLLLSFIFICIYIFSIDCQEKRGEEKNLQHRKFLFFSSGQ